MTATMTEQVQMAEQSSMYEALRIFDVLLWGVALLDEERKLRYYNPEFTRFLCAQTGLQFTEEDLLGHTFPLDSLWESEPEHPKLRWQLLTPNGKHTIVAERLNGESALKSQHPELNYVLQLHPASATQQIPGELASAITVGHNGNKEKLELLTSFSHEFRTPLNAVLGFGNLLLEGIDDKEQQQHVESIISAGSHLLKLVNEILALSKADYDCSEISLNTENVDVQPVVSECIRLLQPIAMQAEVLLEQSGNACSLICDRTRLKQIVLNLLSNAIKYNKPGGKVVIKCLAVGNRCSGLEVQDCGAGIAPELVETIFNPFKRLLLQTGKRDGSGIGLMLTRRLVNMMGGRVRVSSRPGFGSVFAIDFNLDDELSGTAGLRQTEVLWLGHDSAARRFASNLINQRAGVTMRSLDRLPVLQCTSKPEKNDLTIVTEEFLMTVSGDERASLERLLETRASLGISAADSYTEPSALKSIGIRNVIGSDFDPIEFLAELDRVLAG